jgi:hypothetical protein
MNEVNCRIDNLNHHSNPDQSGRAGSLGAVERAGSCAADAVEPGQVREEAAIRRIVRVPQVNLALSTVSELSFLAGLTQPGAARWQLAKTPIALRFRIQRNSLRPYP